MRFHDPVGDYCSHVGNSSQRLLQIVLFCGLDREVSQSLAVVGTQFVTAVRTFALLTAAGLTAVACRDLQLIRSACKAHIAPEMKQQHDGQAKVRGEKHFHVHSNRNPGHQLHFSCQSENMDPDVSSPCFPLHQFQQT